jgi:hypothetical protein
MITNQYLQHFFGKGLALLLVQALIAIWPLNLLWGEGWEYYGANGYYFCFYDSSRIVRPDPERVQVWLKWLATREGKKQRTQEMNQRKIPKTVYEKYEATQVLMEINCREKQYLVLSLTDFDEQERMISSGLKTCFPREMAQRFPLEADTSEEDLRLLLCPGARHPDRAARPGGM